MTKKEEDSLVKYFKKYKSADMYVGRPITSRGALLCWRCVRSHFFTTGEFIMGTYIG